MKLRIQSKLLLKQRIHSCIFRSSHQRCSVKQYVLRNFAKLTGKHLCQSLFFNKVAGLRPATLLKKRLLHRCFPVNFAKFLKIPFSQKTSGRLLLYFEKNTLTYLRKNSRLMSIVIVNLRVFIVIANLRVALTTVAKPQLITKISLTT